MGLFMLLCISLLLASPLIHCDVTYDRKAIVINGKRRILISGSIHYPRSSPEMWEGLIQKAKDGGLDVIDTYVFWNAHEPSPSHYNFEGRNDLVRFIKTVEKLGLYVHLRIGPYVCAEWNFGGFPVWLKYVPGISFRTDNIPFKTAMQSFTQKIVQMMKSNKLFASQGGPIILSQIENEYGTESKKLGAAGYNYVTWAANMAVKLDTGVPWVMCKEDDAPDPIINSCNGFYCDGFSPNKAYKPKMWTEAWSGWFAEFGGTTRKRPVQDLAFAVARFIQSGGSFINYYMYHGGTNFGRTAGGPFITTSYDYDAPIDEYGIIRQPKYGHLKELHKAIKLCEGALTSSDPTISSLGSYQQVHVFSSGPTNCAAFLSNYNTKSVARVIFNNKPYDLPAWSISILPDCRHVIYNTARVGVQTTRMHMLPSKSLLKSWKTYYEDISSLEVSPKMVTTGLLEQINVTRDSSDYLWYTTSVDISSSEPFIKKGQKPTLSVQSAGHALHVFINGQLSGSAYGSREKRGFTFRGPVNLHAGTNRLALLSVASGLPNVGLHFETWKTGILGPVLLHGIDHGHRDLSWQKWFYQVGLKGESLNLASPDGVSSVDWIQGSLAAQTQRPLRWHMTHFDAPAGDQPLALDLKGMGKGQAWINGQSMGRYWTIFGVGNCARCTYPGTYRASKCQNACGRPTQHWYHVPKAWMKPTNNLLVIFEELGGDPTTISLVSRSIKKVCSKAHEDQPMLENWSSSSKSSNGSKLFHEAKVHLQCAQGQSISAIKFASFGNPSGHCGSFVKGTCHATNSQAIIEKNCMEKEHCLVPVSISYFKEDPCPNFVKRLSVEAVCSPASASATSRPD